MDRSPRLAELVVHLTDCAPAAAVEAVARATAALAGQSADPLAIVARAMYWVQPLDLTQFVDLRDSAGVSTR